MKLKNILAMVSLIVVLLACSSGGATNSSTPNVVVNSITLESASGYSSSFFTTKIKITAVNTVQKGWQFGFYMPVILNKIPHIQQTLLQMKICDLTAVTAGCQPLVYQKSPFLSPDSSAMFTTIVMSESDFPLFIGHDYEFTFANLYIRPGNYSSYPQSLFIIESGTVSNLVTSPSNYHNLYLDKTAISQTIESQLTYEWQNSAPLSTGLNVVPTPESSVLGVGDYIVAKNIAIHNLMPDGNDNNAKFIQTALAADIGINSKIDHNVESNGISLQYISISNPEGYKLIINSTGVVIQAASEAGVFYGYQTLRQLWYEYGVKLPQMAITDLPRFKYRGILLDVARHYISVSEIEQLLDIMATHKLNVLHWHLSDDEGFRLVIPAFPQLTTVGASRGYGQLLNGVDLIQANMDIADTLGYVLPSVNTAYSFSYTPSEISQLIQYANARQITVIPEIDIPGHARAMMKAMPNSFYDPSDASIYYGWGDDTLPVCAYNTASTLGNNFTTNINAIVTNIANQFKGQNTLNYITNEVSIGGDEVSVNAWSNAPLCDNPNWQSLTALQKEHKFLTNLDNALGSSIMMSGWGEFILNNDNVVESNVAYLVPANKVGHVWNWLTRAQGAISASQNLAKYNYHTVINYGDLVYFDQVYTPDEKEPGFKWATSFGDTNAALTSGVAAAQTMSGLSSEQQQYIDGVEGGLWTDVIANYPHLVYMALPKMAGLAEAAWSGESVTNINGKPNWQSLANRLGCGQSGFLAYLQKLYNVEYRGYPNGISLEAPQACQKSGRERS